MKSTCSSQVIARAVFIFSLVTQRGEDVCSRRGQWATRLAHEWGDPRAQSLMGSLHWLLHFVVCVPPATSLEHPISLFDLLFFADIVLTINERGWGMRKRTPKKTYGTFYWCDRNPVMEIALNEDCIKMPGCCGEQRKQKLCWIVNEVLWLKDFLEPWRDVCKLKVDVYMEYWNGIKTRWSWNVF